MRSCFKVQVYRNQKMRDVARFAPHCMIEAPGCLGGSEGTQVGCHSNMLEHGHGAGLKAHDLLAFGCQHCHDVIDGRPEGGPLLPFDERLLLFLKGVYNSTLWLLTSGLMKTVVK